MTHIDEIMADQPPGHDTAPEKHKHAHNKVETKKHHDIGETTNIPAQHPGIVKQLNAQAETARTELGDGLTKRPGPGRREPGKLPPDETKTTKSNP
jgi:hypothetical protein